MTDDKILRPDEPRKHNVVGVDPSVAGEDVFARHRVLAVPVSRSWVKRRQTVSQLVAALHRAVVVQVESSFRFITLSRGLNEILDGQQSAGGSSQVMLHTVCVLLDPCCHFK